jgi:phenylpropionate dioxygenase-like ring-hydroxylating dioxygenase large terminal subunit
MNVQDPKSLKPGEARSAGKTVQEMMDEERRAVPNVLRRNTYIYNGSDDLDPKRWTSQEFHDLEMNHVWTKVWQMACRLEEIPNVGDHVVYDIGDNSLIIVRISEDEVRAYNNACLHRGTQLRPAGSEGNSKAFRCPYHGWTWDLEGSLIDLPCEWDFPHVEKETFNLPQAKVDFWGGFVFINLDEHCESLAEFLGDLPGEFEAWDYENKFKAHHIGKRVDMNWKVGVEAFIESYHVIATHPQIMPSTGDANTQYDVDPSINFNRMITPMAVTSPHLGEIEQQEIVDAMAGRTTRMGMDVSVLEVPEGETARAFMAETRRNTVGPDLGKDYSKFTDSEMLDAIQYWVFPNFFPWGGAGTNIVYRFRPDGNNPDSAFMEVIILSDYDTSGPRPESATLRVLGEDEPWSKAEDQFGGLAGVFEQDMANMPLVQIGMKTLRKGITLGNYQESRVRHLHHKIDEYIATK